MEPLLAFVVDFWWIAPATVGAGGVGYAMITNNSRRARRLELDAARHEEALAYRASLVARAGVRAAQADVQQAQSQHGRFTLAPPVVEAKRILQLAKQTQKNTALALRAARTRVRAVQTHLQATARDAQLPLEKLMHEHDDITARWLAYETDPLKLLAFPQMSDARHPATFVFLQAHSEAHRLRPASPKAAVRPDAFVAYRQAVAAAGQALANAEADARRTGTAVPLNGADTTGYRSAAQAEVPRPAPGRPVWPVPSRSSRGAGSES